MSQGLGSVISMWQRFSQLKKMEVRIQVHAACIREYADRLTGDRKSTRLNSSHQHRSRMPSSA